MFFFSLFYVNLENQSFIINGLKNQSIITINNINFSLITKYPFLKKIHYNIYRNNLFYSNFTDNSFYPQGGNINYQNDLVIHSFINSNSNFIINYHKFINVSYLIVGGGGGGGRATEYSAGGGGAGGFLNGFSLLSKGIYSIIIGKGGLGSNNIYQPGEKGGNSEFNSKIAYGGGGGGSGSLYENQISSYPSDGASGGGGGAQVTAKTTNGANGIIYQGNSGGDGLGHNSNSNYQSGGGGGGAGGLGFSGTTSQSGNGGIGKEYLGKYYCGGGGGGKRTSAGLSGFGGSNIGGNGGQLSNGLNAVENTGSGGGGAGGLNFNGGSGSSGTILLSYSNFREIESLLNISNLIPGIYKINIIFETINESISLNPIFFNYYLFSSGSKNKFRIILLLLLNNFVF